MTLEHYCMMSDKLYNVSRLRCILDEVRELCIDFESCGLCTILEEWGSCIL